MIFYYLGTQIIYEMCDTSLRKRGKRHSCCGLVVTNPTSIHEGAGSVRVLRIRYCRELWCRLKMQPGSDVVVAVVYTSSCVSNSMPSLGTSTCHGCHPKKTKKKKKKKKKEKKRREKKRKERKGVSGHRISSPPILIPIPVPSKSFSLRVNTVIGSVQGWTQLEPSFCTKVGSHAPCPTSGDPSCTKPNNHPLGVSFPSMPFPRFASEEELGKSPFSLSPKVTRLRKLTFPN